MIVNLFFFLFYLISRDCSNGKVFGVDRKDNNDVVITFGRLALWVIPRYSSYFFDA
jgi:hypothetical protein